MSEKEVSEEMSQQVGSALLAAAADGDPLLVFRIIEEIFPTPEEVEVLADAVEFLHGCITAKRAADAFLATDEGKEVLASVKKAVTAAKN